MSSFRTAGASPSSCTFSRWEKDFNRVKQFHELDIAHVCECEKKWDGMEFKGASLLEDGRIALQHECESHGKGACTHFLSAETVKLVQNALKA